MKTPVEKLLDFLRENSPAALPNELEQERFLMSEKIERQLAYNAGFAYAKKLYESNTRIQLA